MRAKKLAPVMRGLSAITASVMALSIVGADIADGYRARIDDFLGTQSYVTNTDEDSARFVSDYATFEEMKAAKAARHQVVPTGKQLTLQQKQSLLKSTSCFLLYASHSTVSVAFQP